MAHEHDHGAHDHSGDDHSGHDHGGHDHGGHDHGGHDHGSHGHAGHSHAPASFGRAFAVGVSLNVALVAAQVVFGFAAHSVALLADAVHNMGDVLGLLAAWGAASMAKWAPTQRFTYGWGRTTILAALGNAVILLVGTGALALEAVQRLFTPAPVAGWTVAAVAAAGILINGATALMFMRGRHSDLNVRGAFQHMAADAAVSASVVVAAVLIQLTGAAWLDPVASLAIGATIVAGTWGLLRDATQLATDAVPRGIDPAAVTTCLHGLPGVAEVHDLHIWALSTTKTAITAHLVTVDGDPALVPLACKTLLDQFAIAHATIQIETAELAQTCSLRPAGTV